MAHTSESEPHVLDQPWRIWASVAIFGIVLSAAFLIEQELWKEFATKVVDQGSRAANLRLELTGPWPPYDFVQMQFGG